jgi:cell division cycle 2-like protein
MPILVFRAPEILLGTTTYSTPVDLWSVGCIFAELLLKEPLFQAKGEIELLSMIFKLLGPPTNNSWPEHSRLPLAKTLSLPSPQPPQFRQKFPYLTTAGIDLLMSLLTYDPARRITAEEALQHPYFRLVLGCSWFHCSLIHTPEANPHCLNIQIYLGLSHLWLQEKSACI